MKVCKYTRAHTSVWTPTEPLPVRGGPGRAANGKMIKGSEAQDGWGTRGENVQEGGLTGAGGAEVRPQLGSPPG